MKTFFTWTSGVWGGVLALGLIGCSPSKDDTQSKHSGASAQAGSKPLVFYCWADYCAPAVLEKFEQETGIKVEYETFDDADEVEAKLRSDPGSIDALVVDSFNLNKLRKIRLLLELDKAKLPNLQHMEKRFTNLSADAGNVFSVPYHWGTTLIAYRKDKISDPVHSWDLLWDTQYKGHVMMLDDSFEPIAMALIRKGKAPETLEDNDYKQAADDLLAHIESMDSRYGSDDAVKAALLSGDTWAAMCYSGDAAFIEQQDSAIDFFVPKEGAMLWVDCLSIARDSTQAAQAHTFLNFLMRPDIAALNVEHIRYATPNVAALPMIDPKLRDDVRIFPPEDVLKRCSFVPQLDAEREPLVNRYWFAVRRVIASRQEQATADGTSDATK